MRTRKRVSKIFGVTLCALLLFPRVAYARPWDGITSEDADKYYYIGYYYNYGYFTNETRGVTYENGYGHWNDSKPKPTSGLYSKVDAAGGRYIGQAADYGFTNYEQNWIGSLFKNTDFSTYPGIEYMRKVIAYYSRPKTAPELQSFTPIKGVQYQSGKRIWSTSNNTMTFRMVGRQDFLGNIISLDDVLLYNYMRLNGPSDERVIGNRTSGTQGQFMGDKLKMWLSDYRITDKKGDIERVWQTDFGLTVPADRNGLDWDIQYYLLSRNNKDTGGYKTTGYTLSIDDDEPIINNIRGEDVAGGFYVYADFTDARSGPRDVYLAPYTQANGADDLVSNWRDLPQFKGVKVNGNTYRWFVPRSEHKGEFGTYYLEFYGYDNVGNKKYTISSYEHNPLKPINGSLRVEKYDYKANDKLYWVKPGNTFGIYTDGYLPTSKNVYPTRTYVLFAKDGNNTGSSARQYAYTTGKSTYGSEFSGSFEFINDGDKAINFQQNGQNYIKHTHHLKAKKDGESFKLFYTNTFVDNGTEYYSEYVNSDIWLKVDGTAPTGNNLRLANIDGDKYEILIDNVTDKGSGVNRVMFPTWTKPDQSDIKWLSGTHIGNNTWKVTVNKSNFSGTTGGYITHVYLYDNVGNSNCIGGFTDVRLGDPDLTITDLRITEIGQNTPLASVVAGKEYMLSGVVKNIGKRTVGDYVIRVSNENVPMLIKDIYLSKLNADEEMNFAIKVMPPTRWQKITYSAFVDVFDTDSNTDNNYREVSVDLKKSNEIKSLVNTDRVEKVGVISKNRIAGPVIAPIGIYTGFKTGMEVSIEGASLVDVEFFVGNNPINGIKFIEKDASLVKYNGALTSYDENKLIKGDNPLDNKISLQLNGLETVNFDFILPDTVNKGDIITLKITSYDEIGRANDYSLGDRMFRIKGDKKNQIFINNIR